MASGNFEDISVAWGRPLEQADQAMRGWWRAVHQDLAVMPDGSKLFFLYDPIADETSGTSGSRKGGPSILVFDTNLKKFVRIIPVQVDPNREGVLKYFYLVDPQNYVFAVCTELDQPGRGKALYFWQLRLTPDGMNVASGLMQLFGPAPVTTDWIIVLREDVPEIVLMTGPGLTVWRISAVSPGQPIDSFGVPGGNMAQYYDAVVWRGTVYMLASRPDEAFDFTHVHVLDLAGRGNMRAIATAPDPQVGFPPNRKQTGVDISQGRLYLAGGEIESQTGGWFRMQDVWSLDLSTFQWQRMGGLQLSLPLIEPRLSTLESGLVHVWGDCDIQNGCLAPPTHIHIMRTWLHSAGAPPPTYESAAAPPSYQQAGGNTFPSYGFSQQDQSFPGQQQNYGGPIQQAGGYGQPSAPQYPIQQQQLPVYPPQQQQQGYPAQQQTYGQQPMGGQQPYYPDQGKRDKKDCVIS